MKFNDSSNKQWGECQWRLLSKGILGRAMGRGKLGGTNYRLLTATGGGDVPGPSSIQQVSCIHFEYLDLFLDIIRNKCIYENSINIKWVDFSFLEWRLARFGGRGIMTSVSLSL